MQFVIPKWIPKLPKDLAADSTTAAEFGQICLVHCEKVDIEMMVTSRSIFIDTSAMNTWENASMASCGNPYFDQPFKHFELSHKAVKGFTPETNIYSLSMFHFDSPNRVMCPVDTGHPPMAVDLLEVK